MTTTAEPGALDALDHALNRGPEGSTWRARSKRRAANLAVRIAAVARVAATHRFAPAVPALSGAALVSAGTGGLVGTFAGAGGVWTGLLVAGVFALRFDYRLGS